jgi:hypothetical protein
MEKRTPEHRLLFTEATYCKCVNKLQSHKRDRWYSYYCKTYDKYISENKLEKFIINKLLALKELENFINDIDEKIIILPKNRITYKK